MFEKTAEKFPDREAYVFCEDGDRATFSQFKQQVGTDLVNSGLLLQIEKGQISVQLLSILF